MKISEHWLRDWISLDLDAAGIADTLTMAGLEVDSVERAGPDLDKVVVGRILTVDRHPNAERLTVCQVDIGNKNPVSVVCGAANVAAGALAPVAGPGAILAGGRSIAVQAVRDVASNGMLCSAAELGISEQSDGLLILDADAKPGQAVAAYLRLDDHVIDIDLTPNRGDCLSVLGIARELSVLTGARLRQRDVPAVPEQNGARVDVTLEAPAACPRYVGRLISGIDPSARTPLWMRERLRRCGIRPINLVVDITNYVLLELGQPMHAFDRDRVRGGIVARYARDGEKLVLLDETEITLDHDTLIIADRERPLALAGVMGGLDSAIDSNSRAIVLESAHFAPSAIAGRARRFGLHTDSSHRFERGVDPRLPEVASHYASWWLANLAGGRAGPITHAEQPQHLPQRAPVELRHRQAERILGIKLDARQVAGTLKRIASSVRTARAGWTVTPPSFRFDLERECDLIEEVARVSGYQHIEARQPLMPATATAPPEALVPEQRLRRMLVDRGFQEVITYSFVDPALQDLLDPEQPAVRLNNPLAANMSVMRTSLWPGLLQVMRSNRSRQQNRLRLFEIGKTFHRPRPGIQEIPRLAGLLTGPVRPVQWAEPPRMTDFYDLKSEIEALLALTGTQKNFTFNILRYPSLHPGQAAEVRGGGKQLGILGRLHPQLEQALDLEQPVYVFEFQLDILRQGALPDFREFSRFPTIRRDLAVVVDDPTPAQAVLGAIREAAGGRLMNLELFDVYRGEHIDFGRKSMAFTLTFQDSSRTLKDEEADKMIDMVRAALRERFDAEFRS